MRRTGERMSDATFIKRALKRAADMGLTVEGVRIGDERVDL